MDASNYYDSGKKCPLGQRSNSVKHFLHPYISLGIFPPEEGFVFTKKSISRKTDKYIPIV